MAVNEYNIQRNRVKGALKMQNTVTDKNTERLAAAEQPGTESYWVFLSSCLWEDFTARLPIP